MSYSLKKFIASVSFCACTILVTAQTPYNPDSDGNNLINFNDLLSFLPLFGMEFFPDDSLAYYTCDIEEYGETCFVPDSVSLVFVNCNAQQGKVMLPDGTEPKTILVVGDQQDGPSFSYDIQGWTGEYYTNVFQSVGIHEAGLFIRTPHGYWRAIADQY